MDVTKGLPLLHMSFAILNVHKSVVRKVEADDKYDLLDVPLIFFVDLAIRIGRWNFLKFVYNISKIYECQEHFDF